jgi:hypothetical protein
LFKIETCFKKIGLETRGEFLTFGVRKGELSDYYYYYYYFNFLDTSEKSIAKKT